MAGVQHIGADFFAALDKYVQDACNAAKIASDAAVSTLQTSLTTSARQYPQWAGAADAIEVWEDGKGHLKVGVRNPDKISAAQRAEFGDKDTPPVPIIRNSHFAERQAEHALRYTFGRFTGSLK